MRDQSVGHPPIRGRGLRALCIEYWGLAQPYSNTAQDAPTRGSFTGGLLRTLPGMFIGHNEIVAFLLHRFS
jgi:hypothetical protein